MAQQQFKQPQPRRRRNEPEEQLDHISRPSGQRYQAPGQQIYDEEKVNQTVGNIDQALEDNRQTLANLEEQPEAAQETSSTKKDASEEISQREQKGNQDEEPSWYKPGTTGKLEEGAKKLKGKKTKKPGGLLRGRRRLILVGGGIGGALILITLFTFLLLLIAPYKEVHFASVLRSIALARYTYMMNRQWSRVVFDAAVLTDRATGTYPRGSLVNRLPGINPERQLAQLGREGALQWDFEDRRRWGGLLNSENVYRGVVVDGKTINIDQQARELFPGRENFNDLSRREKMTVRAAHANAYRTAIGEALATVPRSQYWAAYRAFHQATGIRLYGWLNKARAWAGKTPAEARALTAKEDRQRLGLSDPLKSGLTVLDEDVEENRKRELQASDEGRPAPGEIRNRIAGRLRTAGKVSDAVLLITLACVVWHVDKAFDAAQAEREAKAAKAGNLPLSKADQTEADATEEEAIDAENSTYDGAYQSAMYRQSIGRPLTIDDVEQYQTMPWVEQQSKWQDVIGTISKIMKYGVKFTSPTLAIGDLFTDGKASDEAITTNCNILMNEYAQWGILAVELGISIATIGTTKGVLTAIRGGIELAVGVAAGFYIADWIGTQVQDAIKRASNLDFSGVNTGADKYNESAVGMNYSSQPGNRTVTFGRPLNQAETDEAQEIAMNALREDYKNKPFTERYFAMDNPFSLAGQLAAVTPTSATGVATSVQQGVASIGSILTAPIKFVGSLTGSLTGDNVAKAAQVPRPGTSFGVDQWGWSPKEQERIETDPTFLMPEGSCNQNPGNFVCRVESNLDELNDRYWKCYNPDDWQLQKDKPKECSRANLSKDDALYWRYYMAYLYVTGRLTGSV